MSEYKLKRHAIRLWANPDVPRHIVRHNRRQWLRSVLRLGDKWLLARPIQIERSTHEDRDASVR